MWHSPAGQPMACGWPLWASVFLVLVPVLNSQACVFRSQGLGRARVGSVGKREEQKTPLGWRWYQVLASPTWELAPVATLQASGCRNGGQK